MGWSPDDESEREFAMRLRLLEDEYVRARTPRQRRRIEQKVRAAQLEIEKIRAQSKVVDLAYERWWRRIEAILKGDM